jgi:hypothetical protein
MFLLGEGSLLVEGVEQFGVIDVPPSRIKCRMVQRLRAYFYMAVSSYLCDDMDT